MKNFNLPLLLTLCLLCVGCGEIEKNCTVGFGCDGVVQETNKSEANQELCGSRFCIETYVWFNNEIVFANYSSISTDSVKISKMRDSAETILKNLKSLK